MKVPLVTVAALLASLAIQAAEPTNEVNGGQRTADGAERPAAALSEPSTANRQPSTAEPPPTASPTSSPSAVRRPPLTQAQADRLDLDTTVVTGNRELPKVLYIVPWKKADLGDLPAQPFNTLLDEVLAPVDRDVFRREVTYYDAINAAPTAPSAARGGSEK